MKIHITSRLPDTEKERFINKIVFKTSDGSLFHLDDYRSSGSYSLSIFDKNGDSLTDLYQEDSESVCFDQDLLDIMNFICSYEMGLRQVHKE